MLITGIPDQNRFNYNSEILLQAAMVGITRLQFKESRLIRTPSSQTTIGHFVMCNSLSIFSNLVHFWVLTGTINPRALSPLIGHSLIHRMYLLLNG